MEFSFGEYLEKGTNKIIEIVSSADVDDAEKEAIIEAYIKELSDNLGNVEGLKDYEQLAYESSLKHIDERISLALSGQSMSDENYEKTKTLCQRQKELLGVYRSKNWDIPKITNMDIDRCLNELEKKMDASSLWTIILNEDQELINLIIKAHDNLSVELCDQATIVLEKLENDINTCKSKNYPVPKIENSDIPKLRKMLGDIRKKSSGKEALHQKITATDSEIDELVPLANASSELCKELIELCNTQLSNIKECKKNKWPLPTQKYTELEALSGKYSHYSEMISLDKAISNARDNISSAKKYKQFSSNCEKQKNNIAICSKKKWALPVLQNKDIATLINEVDDELARKSGAKIIKRRLTIAGIVALLLLVIYIMGGYYYRSSRVKIPFNAETVAGQNQEEIVKQLEDAGFANIIERPDSSSWNESGKVISVSINNSFEYEQGKYVKPDVNVVVTFYSLGRKYVTGLVQGWQSTDYETIKERLNKAGFNNVTTEKTTTYEAGQDKLVANIAINGTPYTNEICYLPTKTPISITYYDYKIKIGSDNSQFAGQNYEVVIESLRQSGFSNIAKEEITTGWAKAFTCLGVTVNDNEDYSIGDDFSPDARIVVKYSSGYRVDASSILKDWKTKTYDQIQKELIKKAFTNVTIKEVVTTDKAKNNMISRVVVKGETYVSGDCFVQRATPIIIEYYGLRIKMGASESEFKGQKYKNVVNNLKSKGFTNIKLLRSNDLRLSFNEGDVKSIKVNGKDSFDADYEVRYDSQIVIVVKTYKDKGCTDITEVSG